jgi:mRNA (guanine-N7-)-methyltransferase
LGFGKGGDLKKYNHLNIKELYGLDVANRSILDVLERARSTYIYYKLVLKVQDCYNKEFDLEKRFHIISSQFSLHYCFEREEYLNITLGNIERHLFINGYLIITSPSKERILQKEKKENYQILIILLSLKTIIVIRFLETLIFKII